jgi:hypothetical protein
MNGNKVLVAAAVSSKRGRRGPMSSDDEAFSGKGKRMD